LDWASLDLTAHETFTRLRAKTNVPKGFKGFDFLRTDLTLIRFEAEDESRTRTLLEKYADHNISYHDAMCAAVMLRSGIYKIFTFDRDFLILGFQVIPGI
jgi:predicted nucleic acid-binding protein